MFAKPAFLMNISCFLTINRFLQTILALKSCTRNNHEPRTLNHEPPYKTPHRIMHHVIHL